MYFSLLASSIFSQKKLRFRFYRATPVQTVAKYDSINGKYIHFAILLLFLDSAIAPNSALTTSGKMGFKSKLY